MLHRATNVKFDDRNQGQTEQKEVVTIGLQTDTERYLIAARQEGKSDITLNQYGWHLEKMMAWLLEQGVERTGEVSRDLLREWGAGLRDRWSPATVKQAVSAARAFFLWCSTEGTIDADPGQALKSPRVPKRVQRTLTAEEVQSLLAACNPGTVKGRRDTALVNLLVDTGLRASEVCRARVDDLDIDARVLVVTVKNEQREWVFFGETTAKRLRAWLEIRAAPDTAKTAFVSVGGNTPGHPLTTRGLRAVLKRLGEEADIKGVCPHAFRRGFACIATRAGAPSRTVQLAGRWSDIRMVEIYTQALESRELYEQGWSPADYVANWS